tara:strand:+ start:5548 stop:6069 length:522 start_codon:yes stop_codon:yes gene_type:complete
VEKNKIYNLSTAEIDLINFVAKQRQDHKEKTGWDGLKTKSKRPRLELNKMGFGAEFIFCREMNLMPDFKVYNKSKENGSDEYDANYKGFSIDVKCTSKHYPLMVSPDLKSDCNIFAFFRSEFPFKSFRFIGFATNKMLFQEKNISYRYFNNYILKDYDLINLNQLKTKLNIFE